MHKLRDSRSVGGKNGGRPVGPAKQVFEKRKHRFLSRALELWSRRQTGISHRLLIPVVAITQGVHTAAHVHKRDVGVPMRFDQVAHAENTPSAILYADGREVGSLEEPVHGNQGYLPKRI